MIFAHTRLTAQKINFLSDWMQTLFNVASGHISDTTTLRVNSMIAKQQDQAQGERIMREERVKEGKIQKAERNEDFVIGEERKSPPSNHEMYVCFCSLTHHIF